MISVLIILATLLSTAVFPLALRYAKKHNIVDNPNARKLQKEPIPVLGGSVLVIGMLIPLLIATQYYRFVDMWYIIGAILVLWGMGTIDDVRGLPAWLRFMVEVILIWIMIWHPNEPENGLMINSLHGIWGRGHLSHFTAIPLSLLAGVGIINSINLIDGVDGYSSGFGIVASSIFGGIFLLVGHQVMAMFSFITAAALLPFYLHNVFGRTSKMFIGDGGSLVIGMVLSYDVFSLLCSPTPAQPLADQGISLVALSLAIMCIPVFDTLRVMTQRMVRGEGPFNPDKTHLHHLFIELGFSHVGTSSTILVINLLIVALWYLSYLLGAGLETQFYIVIALGVLSTWGLYCSCKAACCRDNKFRQFMCRWGKWTHFELRGGWKKLEYFIDKLA